MAVTAKKKKTKKSIRIQPLGDRIVVERDVTGDVTTGGIFLPESAKDKPSRGVVMSVGEGKLLPNGSRSELQVKAGDHVLFTSYGPDEISLDDHVLLLMREEDVLAVIN